MTRDIGPYNLDLEGAVLASVLMAPEIMPEIAAILQPDDLHDGRHRTIYAAMLKLGDGLGDLLTLENYLTKTKRIKDAGGSTYVLKLGTLNVAYPMAPRHAQELLDLAQRRRLADLGEQLDKAAHNYTGDTDKILLSAQQRLDAIMNRKIGLGASGDLDLLTADQILTTDWPEPIWVAPGLLPAGLGILAGKSKVGKSWLCLQLACAVASGGVFLGERIETGPVLYLALEDIPAELKERMTKQRWPAGLPVDFLTLDTFTQQVGDLKNGGGERIARKIEAERYRLVVIDTFGRAVYDTDQNDYAAITAALSPIQKMAKQHNCAVQLTDHHHKLAGTDGVIDILGSSAKGGVSDTIWGLYRERGKVDAKLTVVGRRTPDKELTLRWDGLTGCWQCEQDQHIAMTDRRQEILEGLAKLKRCTAGALAEVIDQDRSNTFKRLQDLVAAGLVYRRDEDGEVYYSLDDLGHELLQS